MNPPDAMAGSTRPGGGEPMAMNKNKDCGDMQAILELIGSDTPLGIVVLRENGLIRHMNEHMRAWMGQREEGWLDTPFFSHFPETSDADRARMQERLLGPELLSAAAEADRLGNRGQLFDIRLDERRLACILCLPFIDQEHLRCYAVMFSDTADTTGFHAGFSLAIRRLQQIQLDQRILMEKLEHANSHLVRAEKMAGIGQLAAGVAHEINNPIGYVFSNLKTMAGYMRDMLKIIDAADHVNTIEELRMLKRNLDYDYIRGDVGALIEESEEGISRVKMIISALKDFSHDDEEEFHPADLHRAIDTTLNVVNNEIKYKAKVVKRYAELPLVECNISQLNQVIMNLLMNAVHALDDFGTITIRSGYVSDWVWFEVEDTGKGIDPAVRDRIFEPFFTTKPQSEGTGLGLSLSYSIVQKHRGRIDVRSEPGKGARFRVWLPVEHAPCKAVE